MNDLLDWLGLSGLIAIVAAAVGYGRLQQRVTAIEAEGTEHFELLRADLRHVQDRLDELTDFLLREKRGETVDKIRR